MKEDIKEDWMEALRSGQHYQARDKLETKDGRQCCLGVLCDIMDVPRHTRVFGYSGNTIYVEYGYGDDQGKHTSSELPRSLRRKLRITQKQESTLIGLNDDEKASYAEIADWIEVNL